MPPAESAQQHLECGNALYDSGNRAAAADCYHRALQIDPSLSAASFNLGCTLDALSGPAQALPHFAQAVLLRPEWWQARSNLGFALARVGRMAEAAAELQAAAALNPRDAGIRNNLGLALNALGRGDEAHASLQEAIRLDPLYPEAHNNLAILFERYGRTTEAISASQRALALRPGYPEAHLNLANSLKSQGRHHEALAHYREALRLKPDYAEAHSSLLFALSYPAGLDPALVLSEHRAFAEAHRFPALPHDNDPDPGRPLRIGYVSADFREHAVARFIEPVLRHHDRNRFLVFCYSNVSVPDAASARLAELSGRLVNIAGMSDADAAALIRRDRIDILVDLSGHSAGNRLPLFARRAAPLQVTWLGYPQTTGLSAIDYRITDAVTDPAGESERFYSEKLLRLPGNFSCFAPPVEAPEVAGLPALSRGFITFGSFNNPAKITPETVGLWAGALHGVPGSRMLVKGYSLADQGSRDLLSGLFAAQGIGAERLELRGNTPSYREHLQLYGQVDIALDCFPYNGTTTTCEALWMGVPVVTMAGGTHLSRVGASLLQSVGMSRLVAVDAQGFRDRAAGLARDLERLAQLRGTLRATMAASPLTDGAGFTGKLEAAFGSIWRTWCGAVQSPGAATKMAAGATAGTKVAAAEETAQPVSNQRRAGSDASASDKLPALRLRIIAPTGQGAKKEFSGSVSAGARPVPVTDHAARAARFLQQERLDEAFGSFLAALRSDPFGTAALAGIEKTLNLQMAADLGAALSRDATRLGRQPRGAEGASILERTLEEGAALLLARGLLTPSELICRYLLDRGYASPLVSRTLGEIALSLGASDCAALHFRDAVRMGDGKQARIQLVKAEEAARNKPAAKAGERFLLIKAWGFGFWSDVNHLLGQTLLAEMTGRIPVVHWGGNSLFSDNPAGNAFARFFQPLNSYSLAQLAFGRHSFYPPKWSAANLTRDGLNQSAGAWSRCSSLYVLERGEDVVVSDFHHAVHDLVPWIAPGHPLHGMTTDQVYLYLFRRYLKVQPAIAARVESFFQQRLAGTSNLALHVRGGDKGGEDPNLAELNSLYPAEIERHLQLDPGARLFLITDDAEILAEYQRRYGERVIHTGATRSATGQGVHYQAQPSRYRLGEEVLVDALLAARCERFIGNGLSNVSCAVAQMKQWPPGSCTLLGARLDRLRQFTLYRS
jgi:protein O-GlcNAc transferase